MSAAPKDTTSLSELYVTHALCAPCLPYSLDISERTLKAQESNSAAFLPYHRANKHHAPAFWRVGDLVSWLPRRFPAIPAEAVAEFEANLRAVALVEPPLQPLRKSGAGNRTRRPRVRKRKSEFT